MCKLSKTHTQEEKKIHVPIYKIIQVEIREVQQNDTYSLIKLFLNAVNVGN